MSFVSDDWVNFIVFVLPEEVKVYPLWGKIELVKTCEQKYQIPVSLSQKCLGNIWNMFQLFGEKCQPLVGRINYNRPFMDHIRWKKENIFTEKMHAR